MGIILDIFIKTAHFQIIKGESNYGENILPILNFISFQEDVSKITLKMIDEEKYFGALDPVPNFRSSVD